MPSGMKVRDQLRLSRLVSFLYLSLLTFTLWPTIFCLRREDGMFPLVPDYSDQYNYILLRDKMRESLSISNCSMGGDWTDGVPDANDKYDLNVKVIAPPPIVVRKWNEKNPARVQRIFAHVSDNLCASAKFRDVVKGFYKRAKGCYKVYGTDKQGRRVKRINGYGATLHPEHIRCDNSVFTAVCSGETGSGLQLVDPLYRRLYAYPFLVTAQNVIIGRGGMFGLPCGPFGLFSSCEAVKWGVPAAANVVPDVTLCRNRIDACPYPIHNRVFILTQYDDTQIGQFMQEDLPKLVYHLEFLQKNPDIKIHYGFTKQPTVPTFVLPHHFFRELGLEDRLINGTFFAREVYMPREGGCQDIGYNAWEALSLRETFYRMIGIHENADFTQRRDSIFHPDVNAHLARRTVLVLTRSPGKFTQNKADFRERSWTKQQLAALLPALQTQFPDHLIEVFSDKNATLMRCPLCQALAFARADVVIGHHGAGLSNAMFMRPGGVLIEVVYNYDSRHVPVLGIFPRVADIIGLHHFTYYNRDLPVFDMSKLANETAAFSRKARIFSYG